MAKKTAPPAISNVNPDAKRIADNLDALHKNGHNYLDVPIQAAIAYNSPDVTQTLNIANVMKTGLQSSKTSINHIFADPQQNKVSNITQQVSSWFKSALGGLPATESDVAKIQKDMISKNQAPASAATGITLEPNGIWSSEWQNALANASIAELKKPEFGNFDAKQTFKALLNQGRLPVALNSLVSVVASMPRSVLNLMGDAVSGKMNSAVGTLVNPLTNITNLLPEQTRLQAGEAVANFAGERQTTEEFSKSVSDRTLQDIGTLLSFIPLGKLAYGTTTAAKEAMAKGLFTVQPFANVAPKYTILKSIQQSVATGGESVIPRVFPKVVANLPGMGWMYRGIDLGVRALEKGIAKTAPAQMAVRDMFAQRLRLPTIEAANKFVNQAIVTGAVETGIAAIESKGLVETPLDNTIYSFHPISGRLAAALDVISMQANPTRSKAAVAGYSKDIKTGVAALRDALDETGAITAWQKANPDMDLTNLIATHGAPAVYQHITDQLNQISARHAADLVLNKLKAEGPNGKWAAMDHEEQYLYAQQVAHDIWTNSAEKTSALNQARESILLNQSELENGFRSLRVETAAGVRKGRTSQKAAGETSFDNFVQARKIMSNLLAPEAEKYIIHPGVVKAFNEARTAAKPLTEETPSRLLKSSEVKGAFTEANILKQYPNATRVGVGKFTKWYIQAEGPKNLVPSELAPWEKAIPIKLDKSWVESSELPAGRGALGLARIDSVSKQEALAQAAKFKKALESKSADPIAVKTEIAKYLVENFGTDVVSIGWKSADQFLDVLTKQANNLAVDVYPVAGAPEMIVEMFDKIKALGYKPVAGTDIGHYFTKDLMEGVELGTLQNKRLAKVASRFGLSPRLTSPEAISARTNIEANIEIQKVLDAGLKSGKAVVPPGYNATRVIAWLRKGLDEDRELNKIRSTAFNVGINLKNYEFEIKQIQQAKGINRTEAIAQLKMAKNAEYGFRDAGYEHLLKSLTRPMDDLSAKIFGVPSGTPFMNKESADEIIKALWRARLKVPTEMIGGLAKVEDFLYAGLGIAGKPVKIGGKELFNGASVPNVPAYLLAARNQFRFESSILFAYRRIFKTMAKGITESVPPTFYPGQKMRDMGIFEKADALYRKMYPKENIKNLYLDDSERLINQADLFNLYSPRDFTRWNLYWLHEQGYRGEELLNKVEHVMTYGARTAAERSLNAVFYPFSFNKTVMRQFGGYLLTRPGQRVIASSLLYAFDNIDFNGETGQKWLKTIEENYPLIKQLESLNAFKHGIGLGGFGGINAPYAEPAWKAFTTILGPKQINFEGTGNEAEKINKLLRSYIPLLKTTQDLIEQSIDTGRSAAGQAVRLFGANAPGTDIQPVPQKFMPAQTQQNAGWDYRSRLIVMLQQALDYNYKNPDSQIKWGAISPQIPVATGLLDQPINKFTIGELVNYRYPKWDNTIGSVAGDIKRTEADRFIGQVSDINPSLGAAYRQVDDYAVKVSDLVSRDNISLEQLQQITSEFRRVAIELSNRNANFYKFYKSHYERIFGPLEGIK